MAKLNKTTRLSLYKYVKIHTYIYIYIYIHTYTYIYIYIHTCACREAYAHVFARPFTCCSSRSLLDVHTDIWLCLCSETPRNGVRSLLKSEKRGTLKKQTHIYIYT